MRVLFVTMQLGRGYGQGTERYVSTLGDCLARRGHEVSYLAGDPLGLRGHREPGQPLSRDHAGEVRGTIHHHPTTGWMTVAGAHQKTLAARLSEWRPDVLHVANPAHIGTAVMSSAQGLGIPVVVTTMDFWWVCPKATLLRHDMSLCDGAPGWRECLRCISLGHPRAATRALGHAPAALAPAVLSVYYARNLRRGLTPGDMRRWPRRREYLLAQLREAGQVIFPSHATREALQPALNPDRCSLIPYGLPAIWFRKRPARPPGPVEPGALTIGCAGALLPHKGVHVLLAAVRQLGWTNTRVRVAGGSTDSSYERQLRAAAAGLNVEFAGALPAEKMPEFFASLDVFVLPSLWPENLPFSMLEAHAGGVPVIASRLAGVQEQVGDERLLFVPGSAEDLARSLEGFRREPAAIPCGAVMTVEETAERTLAVYDRALRESGRRGG